jgi:flagellin
MSRINSNVTSLVAQNILGRSNKSLEQALNRLSTGLRINTGKDDPAGLIASENLRSDITSIQRAISNTDRANQVIATADSALGQVSSLLNDIRGLVTESANSGALSDEQIEANQLQIDSSLTALNRIAQTTEFQGRRLLDGSLDFLTTAGTNFSRLSDLSIEQANLGASGTNAVSIAVSSAATNAQVDIDNVPAATVATNATTSITLSNTEVQAVFHFDFDTTTTAGVTVTAVDGGSAEGADGNGITVALVEDATNVGAVNAAASSFAGGVITIAANFASGTVTNTEVAAAIQALNGGADFTAVATGGANVNLAAADVQAATAPNYTTNGRDAGSLQFSVTADTVGTAANGVTVDIIEDNSIGANTAVAALTVGGDIEVRVNGTVSKTAIIDAINLGATGYTAVSTTSSGDANYIDTSDTPPAQATLGGGTAAAGGISHDVTLQIGGANGVEIFTFEAGTSIVNLQGAIDAFSDATGVTATINGTTLELESTGYGSNAFVDVRIISENASGTFTSALGTANTREEGTDVVATVNGISALGKGNVLSLATSSLSLNTTIEAGFTGTIEFDITGGGALFQLGPDVVSNQQARFGITSVNTSLLGGASGKLFSLKSGEDNSLANDPTTAFRIVDEAINKITSLRGRLGSFQRTTLETNKNALGDTLVNLTDAESSIRDADFAAETAALTRAQILVQSGTTVLSIANQNPQNVLSLLR